MLSATTDECTDAIALTLPKQRGNVRLDVKGWVMKSHLQLKAQHMQRIRVTQCHCQAQREGEEREGGMVGHEVTEMKT